MLYLKEPRNFSSQNKVKARLQVITISMEESVKLLKSEIQVLSYLNNSMSETRDWMKGKLSYSSNQSLNDSIMRLEIEIIKRENEVIRLQLI